MSRLYKNPRCLHHSKKYFGFCKHKKVCSFHLLSLIHICPGNWWALSPLLVFLCLYLVTSILVNDFYKVPITVAFLVSSCYAIAITRGLKLDQRIYQFSVGAANKNILLMIWIFILAGAFAQSAKQMGAIDATVNLTRCV